MRNFSSVFLRLALGLSFLSAVADRFGWWGAFGHPNVAWGSFARFVAYTTGAVCEGSGRNEKGLGGIGTEGNQSDSGYSNDPRLSRQAQLESILARVGEDRGPRIAATATA